MELEIKVEISKMLKKNKIKSHKQVQYFRLLHVGMHG